MKSEFIIDNNLYIRHDNIITGFYKNNYDFQNNFFIKGHLATQLLLYDKIVIPTKDFGIIPVLIKWLGLESFNEALNSDTFYFIRIKDWLMYEGVKGLLIIPGIGGPKDSWFQEAMFAENNISIEQQLVNFCPDILKKQREQIIDKIIAKTKTLDSVDNTYKKNITNETYKDIMGDNNLSQFIFHKNGNEINKDDFNELKGIKEDHVKILHHDKIRDPLDLLLQVADINMILYFSSLFKDSDLLVPEGAEILLKNKIIRLGIKENYLNNFINFLELENIPNIGKVVQKGEFSLYDIWKIREKKHSRNFRKWLKNASKKDEKSITKLYIASLESIPFIQSLPAKILRFGIVLSSSIINPFLGSTLGICDSFFVGQWLKGYSPKLFLDELRKIKISNKKKRKRFDKIIFL
jgi:hypothetical protein